MIRVFILFACLVSVSTGLQAQTSESVTPADAVQAKIQRARALMAAHQLETAASELETVRAASQDFSVQNIASVMLMNIYLEAGNYGRAEALLEESFRGRAVRNGDSTRTYFALAGQAVNGARIHLARYRSVGISTTDSNLPSEAVNDLDRLRSFLERMVAQAKEITNERKAYDSLSLLEDVLGLRLALARDTEDQAKWHGEHTTARQSMASRTELVSLDGVSALPPSKVSKKDPSALPYATRRSEETRSSEQSNRAPAQAPSTGGSEEQKSPTSDSLNDAGQLNAKATRRVVPAYPELAKQAGASGLVRVHVIVDETGRVVEVSRSEGHMLLRRVAEDAARQWFFDTTAGSNSPARLTGYIDFNFTL